VLRVAYRKSQTSITELRGCLHNEKQGVSHTTPHYPKCVVVDIVRKIEAIASLEGSVAGFQNQEERVGVIIFHSNPWSMSQCIYSMMSSRDN